MSLFTNLQNRNLKESGVASCCSSVGGDLDYTSNTLGLPHHNNAQDMCTLCLANTSDAPHNNFHQDAPWRSTIVDNETYLARVRQPRHPLVAHSLFN